MFLSIVIPCLNEEESIEKVLSDTILAQNKLNDLPNVTDCEIIVVNDGSSDNSLNLLKAIPQAKVFSHQSPQGYGAAIKKGIQQAQGDYIAIFDMDNTYPPGSLVEMADKINSKHQFVVGCRKHKESGMPKLRGLGNYFFQRLIQSLYKTAIKDPCSGMWIFQKKAVVKLLSQLPDKLNFTLYLSLYLLKSKTPFEEVEIDYQQRTGDSKLNPTSDGLVFLYTILKSKYGLQP